MGTLQLPSWWSYPVHCAAGHPWGPGRITVGWMPCDCPDAVREPGHGHLWVRCRVAGCREIWYRPRHTALAAPAGAAGRARAGQGGAGGAQEVPLGLVLGAGDGRVVGGAGLRDRIARLERAYAAEMVRRGLAADPVSEE